MHALAYSLAANQKRVIMIDTNFKEPLPEAYTEQPTPNSAVLNQLLREHGLADVFQLKNRIDDLQSREQLVDLLGNHGQQQSPAELLPVENFRAFLQSLLEHYDFVFLEAAALNQYSDAQELAPSVDRVIAVFNAASSIGPADKDSIDYLRQLDTKFAGAVLTGIDERNL
jgi:succinoglycan biosynthesis transport protein ExoP